MSDLHSITFLVLDWHSTMAHQLRWITNESKHRTFFYFNIGTIVIGRVVHVKVGDISWVYIGRPYRNNRIDHKSWRQVIWPRLDRALKSWTKIIRTRRARFERFFSALWMTFFWDWSRLMTGTTRLCISIGLAVDLQWAGGITPRMWSVVLGRSCLQWRVILPMYRRGKLWVPFHGPSWLILWLYSRIGLGPAHYHWFRNWNRSSSVTLRIVLPRIIVEAFWFTGSKHNGSVDIAVNIQCSLHYVRLSI